MAQYIVPAMAAASTIASSASTLHDIGKKYYPGVKKLVTNAHPAEKFKTAKQFLKSRFTTGRKGFEHLIKKDIVGVAKKVPGAAKDVSKYIASGKGLKLAKEVAGDVRAGIGAVEAVTGNRQTLTKAKDMTNLLEGKAEHYHDQLNKYNNMGKNAIEQFKQHYNPQL